MIPTRPLVCLAVGLGGITVFGVAFALRTSGAGPVPGELLPDEAHVEIHSPPPQNGHAASAKTQFKVANVGGEPVRILSVKSGCGCTVPEVRPAVIAPGKSAIVDVVATPLAVGERDVVITLFTDSPLTPEVDLHLRMIGSRRPPYLLQAKGDLTFLGDVPPDETREVQAIAIEPPGGDETPKVECSLPFFRVEPVAVAEEPYGDTGWLVRTYTYRVDLAASLPHETFTGEVAVVDPWDEANVHRIRVHGRSTPPLRAIPPRVVLEVGPGRDAEASFFVFTKEPASDLLIEPERGGDSRLLVEKEPLGGEDGRSSRFVVRVRPAPGRDAPEGVENVIVRAVPPAADQIVLPVVIATAGGD